MKSCPVSRPVPAGNPLSRPEKSGHQKVGKLDPLDGEAAVGALKESALMATVFVCVCVWCSFSAFSPPPQTNVYLFSLRFFFLYINTRVEGNNAYRGKPSIFCVDILCGREKWSHLNGNGRLLFWHIISKRCYSAISTYSCPQRNSLDFHHYLLIARFL